MKEQITLRKRIAELIAQHGSLRNAALVCRIDVGYLSRLANGEKTRPGEALLRRMGLRSALVYERLDRRAAGSPQERRE